ncbi:hypothetical protein [Gimesia sp.]|uniref:hypothetical protein n=1 Tax=Gimesia sp. TaxID=2024833 RepID=UPI003A959F9E
MKLAGVIIFSILTTSILTGCGSEVQEFSGTLVPVKGKVTINDSPAEGVTVAFIPDKSTNTTGTGAYGITDSSGAFTLKHRTGEDGVEAGNYKVIFSKYTMPDGSPIPGDTNPEAAGGGQSIPPKYSSEDKTVSIVTVKPEGNDFTFELKFKEK